MTTSELQTKIDSRLENFIDEALRICSDRKMGREEVEKLIIATANMGIKSLKNYLTKKLTDYPFFLEDDPRFEGVEPITTTAGNQMGLSQFSSYPPPDSEVPDSAFSL